MPGSLRLDESGLAENSRLHPVSLLADLDAQQRQDLQELNRICKGSLVEVRAVVDTASDEVRPLPGEVRRPPVVRTWADVERRVSRVVVQLS